RSLHGQLFAGRPRRDPGPAPHRGTVPGTAVRPDAAAGRDRPRPSRDGAPLVSAVGQDSPAGAFAAELERGAAGVRPVARISRHARSLWTYRLRTKLPTGAAAGRGRGPLRAGELEPVRRSPVSILGLRLGHAHRKLRTAGRLARADSRPGAVGAA